MRRVWYGVGIAFGLSLFVPSCGSDSDPAAPKAGTGGTRSDAGPDAGGTGGAAGSAGAGSGGESSGGTSGAMGGGAAGSAGDSSVEDAGDGDAGSAGDGSADDGEAGPDGNPCAACPTGACVDGGADGGGADGGVCVECTSNAHCANPRPACDLERNVCVECLPTNDNCPSGQYCGAEKRCVQGCKDGSSCPSGICNASHDCAPCLADNECSAQKLCGTGACNGSCTLSGPATCGTGFSCCEPRCVQTDRDISNCKACGTACTAKQFCGKTGCTNATLPNVCNLGRVTAVLDGAPSDDQAARDILRELGTLCAPAPTTRTVPQMTADVINPTTGRVIVHGGEMLVFVGGGVLQAGVNFLEMQQSLPVRRGGAWPQVTLVRTADNVTLANSVYEEPGYHDIFVIQVGRETVTGTLSLVVYGFHASGTRAAAWYFYNRMLPNLASYPDAYYVYDWVDINRDLMGDAGDTFTLRGSGT